MSNGSVGDGVEHETDGADDVELDDGAPGETFFTESAGRVDELKIW